MLTIFFYLYIESDSHTSKGHIDVIQLQATFELTILQGICATLGWIRAQVMGPTCMLGEILEFCFVYIYIFFC